ncbi:hypothetical protein AB0F96_37110 [Streptomyces sp. NPDC023998]
MVPTDTLTLLLTLNLNLSALVRWRLTPAGPFHTALMIALIAMLITTTR